MKGQSIFFPGYFHISEQTIFEKIELLDIFVLSNERFYLNFSVWAIEAMLLKVEQNFTDKLQWISRHEPINVSIACNTNKYCNPKCF